MRDAVQRNADTDDQVVRVYEAVGAMLTASSIRPGERLNEGAIARDLGTSRTPVREALNRLVADGMLDHSPGKGFFRRTLGTKDIVDLYELRRSTELCAVRIAAERVTSEAVAGIVALLDAGSGTSSTVPVERLVGLDEAFHEQLAGLTGNAELVKALRQINRKLRVVRWVEMRGRAMQVQGEHRAILRAIAAGQGQQGCLLMEAHLPRDPGAIADAVRESYARLYMGHLD